MENKELQSIQNQIGYNFKNSDLLRQAFVRRSYAKENGGEDNEVLEFIGDKALDIIVVKILIEKFGFYTSKCDDYDRNEDFDEFCCEYSEGKLTEIKKRLVQKKTLADRIDRLGLADYLIMGKGDRRNHVENEDSVKEDLFEAIIGAVVLDSEWDWDKIQSVVEGMHSFDEYLSDDAEDNYIDLIRDWFLKKHNSFPTWREGNNNVSDFFSIWGKVTKQYSCDTIVPGVNKSFLCFGDSTCEARMASCKEAYEYLEEHDLLFTIQDEIENPNKTEAINQLETLARRGYFSIPTYDFKQKYDSNGNPVWLCECHIKEYETYWYAESSSKKEAKKSAAFKMLKYVLSEEE